MTPDSKLYKSAFASLGKSWRGSLADYGRTLKLRGGSYSSMPAEQDGYFWIESARQLIGPMATLLDHEVREVHVVGATQVLKSVIGDVWTPFVIQHLRRNMAIRFEDDKKAKEFCDLRLMETIKKHPPIEAMISQMESRHDQTGTMLKFSDFKVHIGGLNEGNTSTLSWPVIWISEAYQHGSDGQLGKMCKRADRFPNTKKIFIESRASMEGEDWERRTRLAHKVPLTWACPHCNARQTWECANEYGNRRDDGTFSGARWSDDEGLSIAQKAATAYWECHYCRQPIHDTPSNRKKIAETYQQDYKITVNGVRVSPKVVCFILPYEAAMNNPIAACVAEYLEAKEAKSQGNDVPMQNWYMERRGIFYSPTLSQRTIISVVGGYDPNQQIANEDHRGLVIDCQKHKTEDDVGTFWAETYAADKTGNSFQLERGFFESWEELLELQKRWKISNRFVGIDGRKWTTEIMRRCAMYRQLETGIHPMTRRQVSYWKTWSVYLGDWPARHYPHQISPTQKIYCVYSRPTPHQIPIINAQQRAERILVLIYKWSNTSVADQLNSLRIDGGKTMPKFEALATAQISERMRMIETGLKSYDQQMSAETRQDYGGKGKWEKINDSRPNHYLDLARMRLVNMARRGLAGHVAAPEG